jgi:hypothetical protein
LADIKFYETPGIERKFQKYRRLSADKKYPDRDDIQAEQPSDGMVMVMGLPTWVSRGDAG